MLTGDIELPDKTTPLIFDDRYMIRVPAFATRSELEIKLFGVVRTGNPYVDQGHLDEIVTVMWSIERMVEASKKGIPIRIIKFTDAKIIFENITRHLKAWKNYKENGININKIPFDDLIALDEFATMIYGHVKFDYVEAPKPETELDRYLKELNFMNTHSLKSIIEGPKKPKGPKTWRDEEIEEIPDRERFDDYFKGQY